MYNEATVIASVIEGLLPHFPHVVCVDDGSSDGTPEIARAAGATVVEHPINLGQGASLQTGFEFALSDPLMTDVVTFDADGQHLVEDAIGMVAKLRAENLDVVVGSRFLDDRTQLAPAKKLVLRAAALYTRITTGMALTDAHNGLRVLGRPLLEKVKLRQNRMAHASELIDQIGGHKARWSEYPTHIVYTDYSRAKGQSLLNSVNILVELLFR
ncbi:glycosyltransferase family 2 protein [Glaciihabitans arcticus]|uniref:Glycosyltransferase family 2 protein n=2 Tax=Glaciihabitans arcticus TaxID=2668039 RepID=A0A4Q9GUM6_9MICO|nr:glycosyltransferase family 2 protein [Glaciihabitans arcticus]